MKFGRTYTAVIQTSDSGDTVTIQYPITLELSVERGILQSANTGVFRFYNLNSTTRSKLLHDRNDIENYRSIVLFAGYESEPKLPTIFKGNIISAQSFKQGPDWITEIDAFDGGFGIINGNVSTTIFSGTNGYNFKDALVNVIKSMPNIKLGAIGNVNPPNSRGLTMMGNSWDVVNRITGDIPNFIDKETAHVLNLNEFIDDGTGQTLELEVTSETGLLQTQRRFKDRVDIQVLFEPKIDIGKKIKLNCLEVYNRGEYKVIGVSHRVIISGATGGEAITTVNLWKGEELIPVSPS